MRMNSTLKITFFLASFFAIGLLAGKGCEFVLPFFKQQFYSKPMLYKTPDTQIEKAFHEAENLNLNWQDLLPQNEQEAFENYREPTEEEFIRQITEAIEIATDRSYQPPPPSTNVVDRLLGKAVSLSGFIVPIDMNEDRSIRSYFLVPYYGACIHYPPPPPNQMVFVELADEGFSELDLQQAYTVSGFLNQELFEDPLGTSAYTLNVTSIQTFYGQPDDVREH